MISGNHQTNQREKTSMAGETTITVIGNLVADPELRFTPSGSAVANFTIASTPRTFNRTSNEWEDGETLFLRSSVWREPAENVVETLTKGMRVIAQGRLKSRSYETKEGEKRTVIEFEIDEIGPSLRYASAKVNRTQRGQGQGQQQGQGPGSQWGNGGQQGAQQGGQWGGGQPAGNWNQTAAQQQVAAQTQGGWGGQPQGQGQPQTAPAQQYAQAAAAGPQQGAQQPYAQQAAAAGYTQVDPAQAAPGQDPWAGGWGTGQEPPF